MESSTRSALVRQLTAAWARLGILERVFVGAFVVWAMAWVRLKLWHVGTDGWIEWDARAMGLAALRFHGSGLLASDLGADLASAMCPPGWMATYFVGTWFTDPYQVSRVVPFALLAFLIWQVLAFAYVRGGPVTASATLFLVLRCPFFWDRMVGANPRAWGLPLVVAFLRYATKQRWRAVAVVLIAQAAFYPSVLLVCAPAFLLLAASDAWRSRSLRPLALVAGCGLVCAALVLPTALVLDPRLGHPIHMDELSRLAQRRIWSLYPLPTHAWTFWRAYYLALQDDLPIALAPRVVAYHLDYGFAWAVALLFAVALVRRRIPLAMLVTAVCAVAAYLVACEVAYRLYVPDRLLHYISVPAILLLLAPLLTETLDWLHTRRAPLCAGTLLVLFTLAANGSGLGHWPGLRDFRERRTPITDFVGTLPVNALVAARPDLASDLEVFSHRSTLFSGITNAPNFSQYGLTVEKRIAGFYDAYYAASMAQVLAFTEREGVDCLVVDELDFGPDANARSRYVEPWSHRALALLAVMPPGRLALAHPPVEAIVFRSGSIVVLDTHLLH